MAKRNSKKALLYVRVSSKEQENEGYSLDAQEKLGREYARKHDLKIAKMWRGSESAWKQERVAFNQMVEYAKSHSDIGHIIFDITDRMTRNDFDKLKIYTLVKEFGKSIHFSRTNKVYDRDSDGDAEFMFDIEVAVAKKMSNDISRKTRMGLKEKAEQGHFPGKAPLGYRNDRISGGVEIDKEIAPLVVSLFEDAASGQWSLHALVERAFRTGLRTAKGNRIGKSTIAFILKNPFYYGGFIWKETLYNGHHEALITKQLFDQVQSVLSGNGHPYSVVESGFAYNNLMRCGTCKCKVLGERKKGKYVYYHCTFTKGRHSDRAYIPESRLDVLFEDAIRRVTIPDCLVDLLKSILQRSHGQDLRLKESQENAKRMELGRAEQRLNRLFDMRLDGEIDEVSFKVKERELKEKIIGYQTSLESATFNPNFLDDGYQILELCNRLYPTYLKSDRADKARILKEIASNYYLTGTSISAVYRKPFSFFENLPARTTKLPRQDSNLRPAD